MVQKHTGNHWSVHIDDGVMIWHFEEDMDLSAFGQEAYDVYVDLASEESVTGMVTVVDVDEAFDSDVFQVWERSADTAIDHGIERWALVAEGIKQISLRGKIDRPQLDIHTTEDRQEAIEWARA